MNTPRLICPRSFFASLRRAGRFVCGVALLALFLPSAHRLPESESASE